MSFKVGDLVRRPVWSGPARADWPSGSLQGDAVAEVLYVLPHAVRLRGYGLHRHSNNNLALVTPAPSEASVPRQEAPPSSNPKQAYGDKKPPLHLIHGIALLHESTAMHSGRLKYGENNFIHSPVEAMTYIGAILRHTHAYTSGERVDAKELVHHLGAVRACCNILLTAEATGMLIDNRPAVGAAQNLRATQVGYTDATASVFAEASSVVEHLNRLYPKPV